MYNHCAASYDLHFLFLSLFEYFSHSAILVALHKLTKATLGKPFGP